MITKKGDTLKTFLNDFFILFKSLDLRHFRRLSNMLYTLDTSLVQGT